MYIRVYVDMQKRTGFGRLHSRSRGRPCSCGRSRIVNDDGRFRGAHNALAHFHQLLLHPLPTLTPSLMHICVFVDMQKRTGFGRLHSRSGGRARLCSSRY